MPVWRGKSWERIPEKGEKAKKFTVERDFSSTRQKKICCIFPYQISLSLIKRPLLLEFSLWNFHSGVWSWTYFNDWWLMGVYEWCVINYIIISPAICILSAFSQFNEILNKYFLKEFLLELFSRLSTEDSQRNYMVAEKCGTAIAW